MIYLMTEKILCWNFLQLAIADMPDTIKVCTRDYKRRLRAYIKGEHPDTFAFDEERAIYTLQDLSIQITPPANELNKDEKLVELQKIENVKLKEILQTMSPLKSKETVREQTKTEHEKPEIGITKTATEKQVPPESPIKGHHLGKHPFFKSCL